MQPSPLQDLDSSDLLQAPSSDLPLSDYREGDLVAGKYLLCHPIGQGAMGSVWQGRDIFLSVPVALKLLRRDPFVVGSQREYLSERLAREAATLSSIRHPAVVRVFDFGASSLNDPYLAMELLEGESLGALLGRSGPLLPEYAVQILLPIAHGLAAVHDLGVIHRDLKPDNLFLSIDGRIQPKLIDFGLVKLTNGEVKRKLTGVGILGTPDYMAPEQALERPNVDARSDVWAYCVVLYEALSGTLPFAGPTCAEVFCALLRKDPPPLTAIGIDPGLWKIVERGLRKEPADRWQSMRELGTALARWLASRSVTVDVTGASLHMEWGVFSEPVAEEPTRDDAPPQALPPTQRTELHSSTRLRRRVRARSQPKAARPQVRYHARPRVSLVHTAFRWTLSAAVLAAITIMPIPVRLVDDVRDFFGVSAASSEDGATTPHDVDVRSADGVIPYGRPK